MQIRKKTENNQEAEKRNSSEYNKNGNDTNNGYYSKEQYEDTVLHLENERNREIRTNQTLMLFSSAGIMTNTFSHELERIGTQAGSRMQLIRVAVKRLLGGKEYEGDPDFDPFVYIKNSEESDNLVHSWINVIMDGVKGTSFDTTEINISDRLDRMVNTWKPLLEKKYIDIKFESLSKAAVINIAEVDLYIIINNFILNSSWFLEQSSNKRSIFIQLRETDDNIVIDLENNGPQLSEKFSSNPDEIFGAGISSKQGGTGIGLWIVREIVNRLSGDIRLRDKKDGFALVLSLPK